MSFQKTLRIFFLIASLLFAQHAAALHLFTHALQVNDRVEQTAEPKQDGELAGKKLCEQCLMAELGNGIASGSASLALQQHQFHFAPVVRFDFSPQALLAFHSRAPPAQ